MSKVEKVALISAVASFIFAIIKFIFVPITGSLTLLAEAWHSLADTLPSIAVYLALRFDRLNKEKKEVGKEYNPIFKEKIFKKEENVIAAAPKRKMEKEVAIGIGFFLFLLGVSIFVKALQKRAIVLHETVLVGMVIGFVAFLCFLLFKFETGIGEKNNSPGLIADGYRFRVDMYTSLLVVITLLSDNLGIHLDRISALIISLLIFSHAFTILKKGMKSEKWYLHHDLMTIFFKKRWPGWGKKLSPVLARIFHQKSFSRKKTNYFIGLVIFSVFLLLYFLSGIFTLAPSEQAIVERFGRPLNPKNPLGPGIHYHIPQPFETVKKTDVLKIRSLNIGSPTPQGTKILLWTKSHYTKEISLLTGENNFIDVFMVIHYRIKNIYDYVYSAAKPEEILKQISNQTICFLISRRKFFEIVTSERENLENLVGKIIQKDANQYHLGIEIVNISFRDMHPPIEVAPAFEDVVKASEDAETYINYAKKESYEITYSAEGEFSKKLDEAKGYKEERIDRSIGESERFLKILDKYRTAKYITWLRIYLESLEKGLREPRKFVLYPQKKGIPSIWFYQKTNGEK